MWTCNTKEWGLGNLPKEDKNVVSCSICVWQHLMSVIDWLQVLKPGSTSVKFTLPFPLFLFHGNRLICSHNATKQTKSITANSLHVLSHSHANSSMCCPPYMIMANVFIPKKSLMESMTQVVYLSVDLRWLNLNSIVLCLQLFTFQIKVLCLFELKEDFNSARPPLRSFFFYNPTTKFR